VYLDPSDPPAERAADLVARMTLTEKASQMVSSRPSVVSDGLRALAPGVATVTATVGGVSGTFVVVVR
jgi:hypothetical protein